MRNYADQCRSLHPKTVNPHELCCWPLWAKYFLTIAMFLISFGWYASVALLFTNQRFQPLLAHAFPVIQGVLGLLLIWLGGRLLFY